ncbi:MAG: sodium:calcium antiporter [Candidatus Nanohaloarchaea archaeon]|nr:sodium:calcium antiporter [Candidatus Nanohaloarchaea archaeon]
MLAGLSFQLQLIVGFIAMFILVFGAEKAVGKMVRIAAYYNIPDVVIAVSFISIGTSLPEIASHLTASIGILTGSLDYEIASATVLGANIGSDVVQQTLVVGIVILGTIVMNMLRSSELQGGITSNLGNTLQVARNTHFEFSKSFLKKDYFPMIGTTLMCIVLGWDGIYSRIDGLVLFGSFLGYMYYIYHTRSERLDTDTEESTNIVQDLLIGIGAMAAVLISAHVVLSVAETVVARTGLGGSLIGVSTIGIVAALPEMMTALSGVRHGAEGISLGTLIGSNITNPLVAIGGGAILSTYWVPRPLVLWDLPMETVTAAMLLAYLLFVSDRKLGWKGGLYLVGLYVFYIVVRFTYFAAD